MDILETDAYDRRQKRNMSCTLLFSLLPFFISAALYLYTCTSDWTPSIMSAGAKAAPTLLLAAVVLSWNGAQSLLGVAGGLVFSAVGDCCLVWPELFMYGMVAFAVAHLLYSLTFLFSSQYSPESSSSCSWFLYLILFLGGAGFYIYLFPFLQKAPEADYLIPGVGVYVFLIVLMGSSAIRSGQIATMFGGLMFMVSDMSLSLQVFKVTPPLEYGHMFVMVTYYLAQLLIAVGDVHAARSKDDFGKWKRS